MIVIGSNLTLVLLFWPSPLSLLPLFLKADGIACHPTPALYAPGHLEVAYFSRVSEYTDPLPWDIPQGLLAKLLFHHPVLCLCSSPSPRWSLPLSFVLLWLWDFPTWFFSELPHARIFASFSASPLMLRDAWYPFPSISFPCITTLLEM